MNKVSWQKIPLDGPFIAIIYMYANFTVISHTGKPAVLIRLYYDFEG